MSACSRISSSDRRVALAELPPPVQAMLLRVLQERTVRRIGGEQPVPDGPMLDVVELPLTLPTELGPAAAVLSKLRDCVRAVELACAAERGHTGRCVLGRRAVLAQSWRDHPASVEPRRNRRPGVASRSKWARARCRPW